MTTRPNKRILVAEDNKVLGDVLRFNLERGGFEVTLARSGDAAAKLLADESYDLLITDVEMPGISGIDLCRFVRDELGNADLPVAICSARGLEIDSHGLKSTYGVAEIIYKPFSVRDLVALASRLLSPVDAPQSHLLPSPVAK